MISSVIRLFTATCLLGASTLMAPIQSVAQEQEEEVPPAIEYRQSVMSAIAANRALLNAVIDDEVPYRNHLLAHAVSLNRLAVLAADIFPAGSGGDASRAKDEIWEDVEEFKAGLTAFQDASSELLESVYTGDLTAIQDAVGSVGSTCGG
ncbi:MAG: cytochrome c, partial [bacterium]